MSYKKKAIIIIAAYVIFFSLFFLTGLNEPTFNLPYVVVQRKADFATLSEGSTNIPMNNLLPTLKSFTLNLPQAVNHSLFRPYLWDYSRPAILLTAVELFFYQAIFFAFYFF